MQVVTEASPTALAQVELVPINRIRVGERFRKDLGDINALAKSITEIGLLHPIVVSEKENGEYDLIAGQRRLEAYRQLGESQIPSYKITWLEIDFFRKGEINENVTRKDFTITEMVEVKRYLEKEVTQIAKKNSLNNLNNSKISESENFTVGRVTDYIAAYVGISGRTLEKAEAIVQAAEKEPERFETLLKNVEDGKTSISYAYDVVSRAERHENPPILPQGVFDVVYADPPWKYYYKARGNPEYHYPLMEDEEIYSLKIPSADNAILFLWATNPKLIEALKTIDAWGFTYKTNLVWIKDKIGTGFYVRGRHELLLIATKGNIPTPVNDTRPDSVLLAPRREHSRKPDEVYDLIESMYPNRRYLELFARHEREKWLSWGDQI